MVNADHHSGLTSIGHDPGSSIRDLAQVVNRAASEYELLKQNHLADLLWVVGELKAILSSWTDTGAPPLNFDISIGEIQVAVARERIQHLATALTEKVKDDS